MQKHTSYTVLMARIHAALHHTDMRPRYLFNQGYRELVRLDDGTAAMLRLLRADDKEMLRVGFARLSDDARYNRFFVRKASLLESELRYLTEVDQIDHFALAVGIGRASADQPEEGLAVARAVRLPLEPQVYEAAVTVIDAYQRHGLGTLLVRRLLAAVAERGGRRVQFWVLPSNVSMRRLLKSVAPAALFREEDELLRVDVSLEAEARRVSAIGA
jgi:GNAT superfamily N-acetyltransferase